VKLKNENFIIQERLFFSLSYRSHALQRGIGITTKASFGLQKSQIPEYKAGSV
jgi:hypothetical protein